MPVITCPDCRDLGGFTIPGAVGPNAWAPCHCRPLPTEHRVTIHDDPPRAECSCGWERHDTRDWLAVATVAHLGLRLASSPSGCGHRLCYDDDGHTDGCLYDSPED